MAYEDILSTNGFAASLDKIKARDNALRNFEAATTAPTSPVAYQLWLDTNDGSLKRRNAANNAWTTIGNVLQNFDGNVNAAAPAFTGHLDAGANRLGNIGLPTSDNDAVSRTYLQNYAMGTIGFYSDARGLVSSPGNLLQYTNSTALDLVKYNSGFNITANATPGEHDTFSPTVSGYYKVDFRLTLNSVVNVATAQLFCLSGSGGNYPSSSDQLLNAHVAGSSIPLPYTFTVSGVVRLKAGDTYQIRLVASTTAISSTPADNGLSVFLLKKDS